MLSFPYTKKKISKKVNKDLGEEDSPVIFAEPNPTVIEILKTSKDMKELWDQWDLSLKELFKI